MRRYDPPRIDDAYSEHDKIVSQRGQDAALYPEIGDQRHIQNDIDPGAERRCDKRGEAFFSSI